MIHIDLAGLGEDLGAPEFQKLRKKNLAEPALSWFFWLELSHPPIGQCRECLALTWIWIDV
jgi:hypothetical protein